jgi:dihydrolipoamide dehydrogenase
MTEKRKNAEIVILGAGPGGYAAAFLAADMGKKTILVDPNRNPGGVCLYRGCIPTKALLHAVTVIKEAEGAADIGIRFSSPDIDIDALRDWKNKVVGKLTSGLGQLARARNVGFLQGKGKFLDSHTIEVAAVSGETITIDTEKSIIATGSVPRSYPGLSFDSEMVMSSEQALDIPDIPKTLIVIGAGYIGLEMSTIYAALGSTVTIVEMLDRIMPGADDDLVESYIKQAGRSFHDILTGTKARLEVTGKGVSAVYQGGRKDGKEEVFEKALVTVGRIPNSGNIGLERTDVIVDDKGFIKTDSSRRTDDSAIFAIGDVAGLPLLAHKATHEGKVAVRVIGGKKAAFEPYAIPSVEYTYPEIAWCGLTETEAKKMNKTVKVLRFPWAASGRAATLGFKQGITKLIVNPETERILGAGIVGAGAGELISEATLAVEMGARASDVSLTVHPHPTLSETIMEAAEMFYGEATDIFRRKGSA